jgi:carbon-monoxide dehydrogenase medium subunit
VKPRTFDYLRAETLADVFAVFEAHGDEALILAGGQSVVPALNMRLSDPAILVDINRIPELDRIELQGGVVRIGALCRHETVRRSDIIARHVPLLVQALAHVAHPAIRNRGTFGGSLCNADPAAELPACALALGATMVVESASGSRRIPASDFFIGFYETSLEPGDVLVAVEVPVAGGGEIHFFDEIARRRGDFALAGLAAVARRDGGRLASVRFAFHSCGDRALLSPQLSAAVEGMSDGAVDDAAIDAALGGDLDPPDDAVTSSETRLHLAGVLVRRALAHLHSEAGA